MSQPEFARRGERAGTSDTGNLHVQTGKSRTSVARVRLSEIDLEDKTFQFRFSSPSKDLLSSLGLEGQREPIDLLGPPPYRIVDGFRRLAAAQRLGWPSMEAFLHRGIDDKEAMRIAFTKNVVRRNLSTLEKAHAVVLARKRGLSRSEVAALFGLSERQVSRYAEYLNLPEPIQEICDDGAVTMAHAKILADYRVKNPQEWKQRIQQGKLDARSLRKLLRQDRGTGSTGRPRTFFKRERDRIRLYGCRISLTAPKEERERVVSALREAIELLSRGTPDTSA